MISTNFSYCVGFVIDVSQEMEDFIRKSKQSHEERLEREREREKCVKIT